MTKKISNQSGSEKKSTSSKKKKSSSVGQSLDQKKKTKHVKSTLPPKGLPVVDTQFHESSADALPSDVDFVPFQEGNMSTLDRLLSGAVGASMFVYALKHRSWKRVLLGLLGSGLLYRGATGHSYLYRFFGWNGISYSSEQESLVLEDSMVVARSPKQVYDFIHQTENLICLWGIPIDIQSLDESKLSWSIQGKVEKIELNAELVADVKNRLIAWRSLPGAKVSHEGSIYLYPADRGHTRMKVMLKYDPPLFPALKEILGQNPSEHLKETLMYLKEQIELAKNIA